MLRTLWKDNDRYLSTYWEKFRNRYYVAGDSAHRDADGYFWIMGRIDDVLKVSGHRLGTAEIESALVANARVAEAAVVGKPHDVKGESVFAFVTCKGPRPVGDDAQALVKELRAWVGEQLGAIAKPDNIRFADNLPKTRSGKIMRRLLRAIAAGQEITQDVSTLENPAIVDQLRGIEEAQPAAPVRRPAAAPARAKPKPKPKARAKPKAKVKVKVKGKTQVKAKAKSRPKAKPKAKAKRKAKPRPKAKARSKSARRTGRRR